VVPQALNESRGLFCCINILVSKRDLYLYPPKKSTMKKTVSLVITMLICIMSFAQVAQPYYLMHDYRKVTGKDLKVMLENEEHFWSKVGQLLVKEGKLTTWNMLERVGGPESEPNILFLIGIGSKQNMHDLNETFDYGAKKVMASMGKDEAVFVKRGLNIDANRVAMAMLNMANYESVEGKRNYVKMNYSKVSDVAKMNELQTKVWGSFIKKSMASGAVNQKTWSTSSVVSPVGTGYDWNYVSADGYTNYEDVLDGGWSATPAYPDLTEIGKLIGGSFYKSVTWKVLMSVNNKGDYTKH